MKVALRAAVSLLLIVAALYLLDWHSLADVVRQTSAASFLAAVAIVLVSFAFLAMRWVRIVGRYVSVSRREHWRVYFYGSFLNSFTPANIGGDVYRAAALKRHAVGLAELVVALLRERLFGLMSFLVGYGLCLAWLWTASPATFARLDRLFLLALVPVGIAIAALAAGVPLVRLVGRWRWVSTRDRLSRLVGDLGRAMVLQSTGEFVTLLGLSLLALAAWLAAVAIIAGDLGIGLAIPVLGAIAVLTELVRLVPVSLQGIGLREGSFSVLVGLAGGSPESGFVLGAWSYLALSLALVACWPIAAAIGTAREGGAG